MPSAETPKCGAAFTNLKSPPAVMLLVGLSVLLDVSLSLTPVVALSV